MKLTIDRSDLLRSLSRVRGVVEKSDIPILNDVLIQTIDDKLSFRATDTALEITAFADADVESPGSGAVPAQTFYEVARRLPDGAKILLESDDKHLVIRAGRSRFKLPVLPAQDFPIFASDAGSEITIPSADLVLMIEGSLFAAAVDDPRAFLSGVYLHSTGGLRAVATDGYKLAQYDLDIQSKTRCPVCNHANEYGDYEGPTCDTCGGEGFIQGTGFPGIIIPRRTLAEVLRIADGDVRIIASTTRVQFDFGDVILTSKLIDATFPDYSRVIPFGNDKTIECDRKSLDSAVGRVAAVAGERGYAMRLEASDGKLTMRVEDPAFGSSAEEEIDVDYYDDQIVVGLNSRYLLEILAHITEDIVVLRLADDKTPVLVQGKDATASLFVINTMRLV